MKWGRFCCLKVALSLKYNNFQHSYYSDSSPIVIGRHEIMDKVDILYCSVQMFSRAMMSNFHVSTSSSNFLTLPFFSSVNEPFLSDFSKR